MGFATVALIAGLMQDQLTTKSSDGGRQLAEVRIVSLGSSSIKRSLNFFGLPDPSSQGGQPTGETGLAGASKDSVGMCMNELP